MYFRSDNLAGSGLLAWHAALQDRPGHRAELRRCTEPGDAVFCAGFHTLLAAVAPGAETRERVIGNRFELGGLCRMALLAARVKKHDGEFSLGCQLARPKLGSGSDRPRVSADRIRSLLAQPDPDEALTLLLAALALIDHTVNLPDAANAAANWTDATRRRLALDYYGALTPAATTDNA